MDGLGRPAQTVVKNGSSYVVAATQYDSLGRPWARLEAVHPHDSRLRRELQRTATSFYNTYLSVSNAKPYLGPLPGNSICCDLFGAVAWCPH